MSDDWPLPDHDVPGEEPEEELPPIPPPDVWEFYRTEGRWPDPLEA